jgi:hypothetical protein
MRTNDGTLARLSSTIHVALNRKQQRADLDDTITLFEGKNILV